MQVGDRVIVKFVHMAGGARASSAPKTPFKATIINEIKNPHSRELGWYWRVHEIGGWGEWSVGNNEIERVDSQMFFQFSEGHI